MKQILTHDYTPAIMENDNKENFYLFPLYSVAKEAKSFPTISEMLDRYFFGKAERDRVKQQAHDIERLILNEKEKNEKKIVKLRRNIKRSKRSTKISIIW